MINFLMLLIVPTLIALVVLFFSKGKIKVWEFAAMVAAPAVLAVILVSLFTYTDMRARELWNGQITAKSSEKVSCSHSYPCRCRTVTSGSGKNQTSTTVCDTCYEHPYDVDWILDSSTNERALVDRVDRQGLVMPSRWGIAYIGEPFTSEHSYENYLLLHKDSVLFGGEGDTKKFSYLIPLYPRVFDIYRANHFLLLGGSLVDSTVWNWLVNEANKKLGPSKQVNLIFIIAKTDNPNYVRALKTAWLGGQKNDFIVVIGTLDGYKIEFADVISWTPREDLKVAVRSLIEQTTLDKRDDIVNGTAALVNDKFQRMHMKEYKYLLSTVELSTGEMVTSMVLCVLAEIGMVWLFLYIESNKENEYETSSYRY